MTVVIEIISKVLISIRDPKPYQQKTNRFSLEPLAFYLIPPYFYLKPYFFNRDTLRCLLKVPFHLFYNILQRRPATKENRIYIRVEFRESFGMNLSVPFSLKGSSKCANHVNVRKLYAVEYITTVSSLDYPFQFRIL